MGSTVETVRYRQLNIEEHQMNIIEHDHPNNCEECCSKMLSDWLNLSSEYIIYNTRGPY